MDTQVNESGEQIGELQDAQLHVTGAMGVIHTAMEARTALDCDACHGAVLLLKRAIDLANRAELEHEDLGKLEFVHKLYGALEILEFGRDNDRGIDDPKSGLPLSAAVLAYEALEEAQPTLGDPK